MNRKFIFVLLFFLPFAVYSQSNLEDYFNLCLEFGAPMEIVQLFQPFRTYKGENNGSISYVVKEDNSLLKDTPYSEYQIWYTIDKEQGLYQTSLIIRGDKPVLQSILTSYLKKFNGRYGEAVYTSLGNGGQLIFWYDDTTFTVKARLLLDIVNSYKFVSITFCSPLMKHTNLLKTLYNGTPEEEQNIEPLKAIPSPDSATTAPAKEAPAKETSAKEAPAKETPVQAASDKAASDKAAPEKGSLPAASDKAAPAADSGGADKENAKPADTPAGSGEGAGSTTSP